MAEGQASSAGGTVGSGKRALRARVLAGGA